MGTFESILNQQKSWAEQKGKTFDSNYYTTSLKDNLNFYPMLPETQKAFESGSGKELGEKGSTGKMQALYSSSALVVNFFEYWVRFHRIQEIAKLCDVSSRNMTSMVFEKKHKIANLGTSHLDIEINGDNSEALAIEAKFAEPYEKKITQRNGTNLDKYLAKAKIWEGLTNYKQLAEKIVAQEGSKTDWRFLDVPQLIKHILGLKYCYGGKGFTILYIWFNCYDRESIEHGREITIFSKRIIDDINFRSITYQALFNNVCEKTKADTKYISYLRERYFPKIVFGLRPGTKRYEELVEAEEKYTTLAGNPDKIRHSRN
jgi:hypothetical protein